MLARVVSGGVAAQASAFAQVVMIDVALAGDNAVAVGMAAAGLPPVPMALLLVADPEARTGPPPPALLREAFGLTRAEAEVAARAANGDGVPALAAAPPNGRWRRARRASARSRTTSRSSPGWRNPTAGGPGSTGAGTTTPG